MTATDVVQTQQCLGLCDAEVARRVYLKFCLSTDALILEHKQKKALGYVTAKFQIRMTFQASITSWQ